MFRKMKAKIKEHEWLYQFALKVTAILGRVIWKMRARERRVCYGGGNTHFYVLRRYGKSLGIASNLLIFLGQLKYMEEYYEGYQPVVDMRYYFQSDGENVEVGNAWESMFLQPNEKRSGMEEVHHSRDVILACAEQELYEYPRQLTYKELVQSDWDYYFKKYIILRADLKEKFMADWHRSIPTDNAKVIGIKMRGTDYTSLRPKGHYVQPTMEQIIEKLKDFLGRRNDYKYIFLSTEDPEIFRKFSEMFQDKIISIGDKRINHYNGGAVFGSQNTEGLSRKALTMQYLEEMFLLSQCDSLICGITSSLVPTLLWNEGRFEEVYVFDLGVYE